MTKRELEEMHSQALLSLGYALWAVVALLICIEHGRRAQGARRGYWLPGRWVPR